jgi:hypothetical protein
MADIPYIKPISTWTPLNIASEMNAPTEMQPRQFKTKLPASEDAVNVGGGKCDFSGKHVLLFRKLKERAFECPLCHYSVSFGHQQFEGFKEHVNGCCVTVKEAGGTGCPVCERAGSQPAAGCPSNKPSPSASLPSVVTTASPLGSQSPRQDFLLSRQRSR